MVRFDWEMSVRRLNKELATYPLDFHKDLPLNAPVANVFKKRVAIYEIYRTVGKGQVCCIGHDECCHIRMPAYITGHNVKSNHSIPDAELYQPVFKLSVAISDVEYILSLMTDVFDEELHPAFAERIPGCHKMLMPPIQQPANESGHRVHSTSFYRGYLPAARRTRSP